MLHNSWGVYLCERLFGHNITNGDGKLVSVRDIAEEHIIEDMGRIPSITDYLRGMPLYWWLGGKKRKHTGRPLMGEDDHESHNVD